MHLAARRAREINNYYHQLGEGLGIYTPPLVDDVDSNQPLSIALEEIARQKVVATYAEDARRAAEELLGGEYAEEEAADADIVVLGSEAPSTDEESSAAEGE